MSALQAIRDQFIKLGYARDAIVSEYVFSDVFSAAPSERTIPLAAFTRTPASYRNAAFGVILGKTADSNNLISAYRALGAPILFLIENEDISVWKVQAEGKPSRIAGIRLDGVAQLFSQHLENWNPGSIHRAKSIGQMDQSYQLSFVDVGLLPVIESEIHAKLDRLLADTLEDINAARALPQGRSVNEHAVFRTVFRLLSAKILQDRDHALSKQWDPNNLEEVLRRIREHYGLPEFVGDRGLDRVFASGWDRLRRGISFRNISADDLAFVYENTLVTPETRKTFGTHSTPRQVAEYVVNQLKLSKLSENGDLKIYEPFTGAGVFLVAAMRQLKDLLPLDWTEKKRHDFLIARISGDELDSFACEVARLSLILADYPNANGWHIGQADLFAGTTLNKRAIGANIVLCNPPFEDFTDEERGAYPKAASQSHSKPIFVLNAILDAAPDALGFVLPPISIDGKKYAGVRQRIEERYRDIEIVSLPEHTFKASNLGSALLIAREPRTSLDKSGSFIKSSGVVGKDREHFLATGEISYSRSETRRNLSSNGALWIRKLDALWEYLASYPRFGSIATVHRGLEWNEGQTKAVSDVAKPGFVRGLASSSDVFQYHYTRAQYLDTRSSRLKYDAISLPWRKPKLLANAVRRNRGMWNLGAVIDRKGLLASQQIFGIWPKDPEASLEVMCAVLNGPVASAFSRDNSTGARLLISAVTDIPIPPLLPNELTEKVRAYMAAVNDRTALFTTSSELILTLLSEIDAAVLKAYDLPPRLEKTLLEQFRNSERPVAHEWSHWFPDGYKPFTPLHEYLSAEYEVATQPWIQEVFKELPPDEATALREFMD